MSFNHPEPIIKPAQDLPQDPAHRAAIIFLHGLGDDATPYASMPEKPSS
jgi:predicted esterase